MISESGDVLPLPPPVVSSLLVIEATVQIWLGPQGLAGRASPVTASGQTRCAILPLAIQRWSLTSPSQDRRTRHPTCRYFIVQLAESPLTQRLFAQTIRRVERLASHPSPCGKG